MGAAARRGPTPERAPDPNGQALLRRYERVVERLAAETAASGPNVLITAQDRETSLMQSRMAEAAQSGMPLPGGRRRGAVRRGAGGGGGDILGWLKSLFDHVDVTRWHSIIRPEDGLLGTIAESGRVAVLSDWGTNLYGAPVSAASIARTGGYEMLLHLGDIYFSGTPSEAKARFLDAWPTGAAAVSRALNGNHEMYSDGYAYYDEILPHFGQASSYFAVQNAHWLLVGLDTAHTDHAIDAQQAAWLNGVVAAAGDRKVVLFSHHQPFSRLNKQGPDLQAAMADLLCRRAITAWYWGHEHDCVVYDPHPRERAARPLHRERRHTLPAQGRRARRAARPPRQRRRLEAALGDRRRPRLPGARRPQSVREGRGGDVRPARLPDARLRRATSSRAPAPAGRRGDFRLADRLELSA